MRGHNLGLYADENPYVLEDVDCLVDKDMVLIAHPNTYLPLSGYMVFGDTLVVTTIGQNGKTWLDMRGLPGTEALRVTERFSRRNIGRIDIDVTIDDSQAYTKPWSVKLGWTLLPDAELIESICEENNKDLPHMVGK